ncbi:MAG: RNA polymerase sigma-70 factor, partial [Prevotella sp.]|nr:RNA polymerase sigma-70 factor [Prevotella sp.]
IDELATRIQNAIRELPDSYRETFELSRFGDMTNAQIAVTLSVSIKTVEYRISQSLKILRLKLKDYIALLPLLA